MANIDLHTLRVFDEIYKSGSLSKTAERLGLTQPAISIALAKLRRQFDDALFVRIGHTMRPTPQAEGMLPNVQAAIAALEGTLSYRLSFDAATTDTTFRIAMTDIGQIVLLPRLLNELAVAAPHASVEMSNITDRAPQLLESGELDLVVGFAPQFPAGFYQQALFRERFACLARSDHPRIRDAPTLDAFKAEGHVVVVTSGTGHLILERTLQSLNVHRPVKVRIPNFLGLATIVGTTDYICTLPRRAALIMARDKGIAAWDVPFELPDYVVKQHWHERQMRDPANRWLREMMSRLFLSREAPLAHAQAEDRPDRVSP
ncbi:LysR family transcriptional regulator [Ramlibacter sp. AW1]|uniref:LysR family transcriptional regulator n=1 Tax=Ramlibacter aurantiacus TaxID=2801330 RepID=A0A937D220_9BURK|nr:LysR family transcriptional regulator [Ramlibacter aurantiacus]MBL0421114.1 LysR family transcriptional regulator [Ramlibacter aurantiacus]